MDKYYIGTYWYGRRESTDECARRTEHFFHLLAKCDPIFSSWFEQGWTLEEALEHRIGTDASTLSANFLQQSQEEGRFPTQGFSLGLWNGEGSEAASSLSIYCGDAGFLIPNHCIVYPPNAGSVYERIVQASMLSHILRAMVAAWEPDWGVVSSHEHRDQVSESAEVGTFLGWLTYFSRRRGLLPTLPPPMRVEPLEDQGSLVLLTPERLDSSDPTFLPLARDAASRLSPLGLLSPLQPAEP